jgi:AcrR family transcriptional regulator
MPSKKRTSGREKTNFKRKSYVWGETGEDAATRLVLAASRLFNAHGIHATGIDQVIIEAGVARMTLYKHFGSKEGLVRAAMEHESKTWFEWLDAELDWRKEPRERIQAFFELLEIWFARHDFKGCSFINAVGEHDRDDNSVGPVAKAHRQATCAYIKRLLEGSTVVDRDQLANQLTMLADGATVTAMVTGRSGVAIAARQAAIALLDSASSYRRIGKSAGKVMA